MMITPKMRYAYLIMKDGCFYQGRIENDQGEKWYRFSRSKSDGKRFESIQDARELSGKIGGSRIMRYNKLTGALVDVEELIKCPPARRWREADPE